jgi:hypothetical protein
MSYSIGEAVRDSEERTRRLQAVEKRFPEARQDELTDGSHVWVSDRVKPNDFSLHVGPGIVGKPSVQIHFYEEVAGVRVYDPGSRHADTFIKGLNPELRAKLLLAMLDGAL